MRYTVFCGSSSGNQEVYEKMAYALGAVLAQRQIGLVYGGARVGLMGSVAQGALDNRGEVIGVLPQFLQGVEVEHGGLTELIIVETMHERKAQMDALSQGVIALPGGFGTLEEFFEMLTWAQLGLHHKPMALLNVNGFYNPLLQLIQAMTDSGFLKRQQAEMVLVSESIEDLLEQMDNYQAPKVGKWIEKKQV